MNVVANADANADANANADAVDGDVAVIRVQGRVDAVTAPALEHDVRAALDAGRTRLLFDVSALDYISSAGLRVLMLAARELRGKGAIAIGAPSGQVRQLLELAGVGMFAKIHGTVAEAADALR